MYLKSLELQGFKSFPDKTTLNFDSGATVIIGPNGSGKSNISDAMRWVLGEISTKNIRGAKMEDVIFGGSASRKPMGYAEVSVTFDNTGDSSQKIDSPYDEITVTRRYYRAGESEYFINRKPVRLRDIYEMFMNTGVGREGYSIIGQGRIAEIISRKSDERRSIFEDAAGIAKYRFRKHEAELRLESTDENMVRINDIKCELESRVGPLEKEAEKARKYLALYEEKKRADVSLWLFDTERLREDTARAEDIFRRSALELDAADDAIRSVELQNDKLYEATLKNKQSGLEMSGKIREQEDKNHTLDSALKVNENNIIHIGEQIKSEESASEELRRSLESSKCERDSRAASVSELEKTLASRETEHAALTEEGKKLSDEISALENELASGLAKLNALTGEATDLTVRVSVLENAKKSDADKKGTVAAELEGYDKTSAELRADIQTSETTVAEYGRKIGDSDRRIAAIAEDIALIDGKMAAKNAELAQKQVEYSVVCGRRDTLKRMEEHFEGYASSVRFVMQQYENGRISAAGGRRCGEIYGPLSKLINVDEKYITAVETALGANLQNIVVEDEETAKAAIYTLKNAGAGRATFYPLTSMRPSAPSDDQRRAASYRGYVGTADTLVSCDEKYRNVVGSLLSRTLVFDDIDNATNMAKALRYRVRAVTLDGQQINVGGSFTGGSAKKDSGMLSRSSDIEKLTAKADETAAGIEKTKGELSELSAAKTAKNTEKSGVENERALIAAMQNSERIQLDEYKAKLGANESLSTRLRDDVAKLAGMRERYEEDLAALSARLKATGQEKAEVAAYREKVESKRASKADEREENTKKTTEKVIEISALKNEIASSGEFLNSLAQRVTELENGIESHIARVGLLREELEKENNGHEDILAAIKAGEAELEKMSGEKKNLDEGAAALEKKAAELRQKQKDANANKENVFKNHTADESRLTNLRAELDKLTSKLWEDYELTRTGALELGYPALDAAGRKAMASLQTEAKNKLRAIGTVNVSAIDEYAEVKGRYDAMMKQINDLVAAKKELTDIISRLEEEMKTSFVTAFNSINENFGQVFSQLFGGGSAEISLTDPEDVLGSGIEIKAAPPGKIIKSLMQLSGGEQAFVAIALFFAILKVNPTPFCILDEIEAALDEANVERFANYIHGYSGKTQFIMITHRRGTMEVADRLYGVTMAERGISKVITLDTKDIEKYKGDNVNGIF